MASYHGRSGKVGEMCQLPIKENEIILKID